MLHHVLLTGGTGFIGPFLMKSLLEQTQAKIHVLVRASDEVQGKQRLTAAMESMGPCPAGLMQMFEARIVPGLRRSRSAEPRPDAGDVGLPRQPRSTPSSITARRSTTSSTTTACAMPT